MIVFLDLDFSFLLLQVPVGCGVKNSDLQTDLLYNEFIVYDVGQVNSKYLFRLKFNYKI